MSKSVLFVCTGNVCRSPMAEGLFREMIQDTGAPVEVSSAGIGAMEGMPPSSNSIEAMAEIGIDIADVRSRMVTPEMVDTHSHIFGLARSHVDAIRFHFPISLEKTFVLREFLGENDLDLDVPDPIGMELDEYRKVRNLIAEALPGILNFVVNGDLST